MFRVAAHRELKAAPLVPIILIYYCTSPSYSALPYAPPTGKTSRQLAAVASNTPDGWSAFCIFTMRYA